MSLLHLRENKDHPMTTDRNALADRLDQVRHDEIADLKRQLAECFRLSGADPDGNEDWRLAPRAVEEVRRLRSDYDDALVEIGK